MWLHAGKMHLIGNLFFLCLFGNSVCAKIGHIKFLLCYVLFGLAAGACQLLVSKNPSLGASGAINGVVGMYLVLYPTNNISCLLYVLPLGYFKTFEISGFAVVLFFLMIDIIFSVLGIGNTAYFAHFGGLAAGIITASLLLLTGLVKMKADEISIYKVFAPKPVPQIRRTLHERILMRDYANSDNMSDSQSPAEKLVSKESFIYIQCKCGMRYKISAEFAGKTGKCPRCNQRVKIPLSN
jgi:hypothetical protein